MKANLLTTRRPGFTLMETVIAIGVVAVMLTGFLIVFTPAAEGIKKSISIQEADRLVAALEQELVNSRPGDTPSDEEAPTGFQKALIRVRESTDVISKNLDEASESKIKDALLVYQYRGNPAEPRAEDGSATPVTSTKGQIAGEGYTLVPMMRRKSNPLFLEDLKAIEGSIYLVKCVQMVYVVDASNSGQYTLKPLPVGAKARGKLYDPTAGSADEEIVDVAEYPEAVLAFAAEFYRCPNKSAAFLNGTGFTDFYKRAVKPVFTRNLAVRR